MTLVFRLSGGQNASIQPGFMIFKIKDRNCPIRGVLDDVPGISHRTGPKGWMDTQVMPLRKNESKSIYELPRSRRRVIYLDNCSGHSPAIALREASGNINTEMCYFPKNETHLIVLCDSHIVEKIKSALSRLWE